MTLNKSTWNAQPSKTRKNYSDKKACSHSSQQGVTLIELLISMLIGLFIITTVTQIFLDSNKSNNLNRQLGLMQEAARIATTEIASDIRTAGFTGCSATTELGNNLLNNLASFEWLTSEQVVQGLSVTDTRSKIDSLATTESLLIFKLDTDVTYQITNHNASSNTLTLDTDVSRLLSYGQAVGISRQDCSQVSLVSLSSVNRSNVGYSTGGGGDFSNCRTQLKGTFRCYDSSSPSGNTSFNPGYLRPLDSVAYFIKQDNSLPTLFRKDTSNGTGIALVDGIEDMRIYYGIDTNDDRVTNQYINAGSRAYRHPDWSLISSVRIHLLVRSESPVIPPDLAPKAYFFDGSMTTPPNITASEPDRFLRKEYVMTMALRNKK